MIRRGFLNLLLLAPLSRLFGWDKAEVATMVESWQYAYVPFGVDDEIKITGVVLYHEDVGEGKLIAYWPNSNRQDSIQTPGNHTVQWKEVTTVEW